MILESADKMHKITTECIEPCDINDEHAQNIKKLAKQGIYSYTFQGELDFLTARKLQRMQYIIDRTQICDKVFTKISW